MTGVSPAGAVPLDEDGPGTARLSRADFLSDLPIQGLAAPALVGPLGARAAGLALRLDGPSDDLFEVAVVGDTGEPLLRLGPFPEAEVVAVWRALGAASGLPLMVEHADGRLRPLLPQVGPLLLGPTRARRRHGLLNGRRPRFLVKRKTGRLPLRPLVHREREIVGRD